MYDPDITGLHGICFSQLRVERMFLFILILSWRGCVGRGVQSNQSGYRWQAEMRNLFTQAESYNPVQVLLSTLD